MTKLFVGGLNYAMTSQDLKSLFAQFGEVQSVQVITDKFTNQSKGFGFIEMQSDQEAQEAIKALDGSDQDGRRLGVSVAKPREDKPGFSANRSRNSGSDNRNYFKGNSKNSGSRNRY